MKVFLQTQRPTGRSGLESLVPNELFTANQAFYFPGGTDTSHNYGGNLEIAPPYDGHPFGQIVIGGGTLGTLLGEAYQDHMNRAQRDFMTAQGVQTPLIEISTEWLAVGHVDEVVLFLPNPTGDHWKAVLASPALAKKALTDLADAGHGDLTVFAGRDAETTVSAVLRDRDLMVINQAAQTRIDQMRTALKQALSLTDADFVEVPVLYESQNYDGIDLAAAYNPGVANLIVVGNVLFIPDPEGPKLNGVDVWQQQTSNALADLGFDIRFQDVFTSYHELFGEAHCGTNVERTPFTPAFWEGGAQ
jgi:protein-arginine deiminase